MVLVRNIILPHKQTAYKTLTNGDDYVKTTY